jgi:quercetin dioxygenase-like cupin family protein
MMRMEAKMERDEFESVLQREGYTEVTTVQREAGGMLAPHAHPFEAHALVLDGELRMRVGGEEHVYRPGDTFHLPAHTLHTEWFGPAGVRYLVGRKPEPAPSA